MAKPPVSKKSKKLNAQQERFCEFVAAGLCQTDAYLKAGYKATKEAARRNAARLMTNADVSNRVKELQKSTADVGVAKMTKQEKLDILAGMIRVSGTSSVKDADKLRAIELHSKLLGHFEPDRMELEFGNKTLQIIKERAAQVGYTLGQRYATPGAQPNSRS